MGGQRGGPRLPRAIRAIAKSCCEKGNDGACGAVIFLFGPTKPALSSTIASAGI
jgi:hypothetical protein